MTPGFSAEIAVLGLSIGLLLSLLCYLITNLSPGGMITPGWIALVVLEDVRRMALLMGVVVVTVAVMLFVRGMVILYGKRLFATSVMVAVFVQLSAFLILIDFFPATFETTTLGFIVPGLIAYQLIRQPVLATFGAIVSVTALTYGVMLSGVVFNLIPGLLTPDFGGSVEYELTPLRIGLVLSAVAIGFIGVGIQMRRVRRPSLARPASSPPAPAAATRKRLSGESTLDRRGPRGSDSTAPVSVGEGPRSAGHRPRVAPVPDSMEVPANPPITTPPVRIPRLPHHTRRRSHVTRSLALVLAAVLLFVLGVFTGRASSQPIERVSCFRDGLRTSAYAPPLSVPPIPLLRGGRGVMSTSRAGTVGGTRVNRFARRVGGVSSSQCHGSAVRPGIERDG